MSIRTGESCFYGQRKESPEGEGDVCLNFLSVEEKVFQKTIDGVIAEPY